ncbi:MAG: RNA-binding protein [Desulfurococcales archaeon ex4484_42]|nr:MAG: RNA-binding protein [Desulfurococcales archaeon ex4484_42]
MKIQSLRKKRIRLLKDLICNRYPGIYNYISNLREGTIVEDNQVKLLLLDGEPIAFFKNEELIPTLYIVKKVGKSALPRVVVDEGAVKHLLNGADVMVPGITYVDSFNIGDIVSVWEPKEVTPIIIGKALMSANDIKSSSRGKAIKNLHYAGDKIWKLMLRILQTMK